MSFASSEKPLIRVQDLEKHFVSEKGFLRREARTVKAVNGVSFDMYRSKTLGLVGESGCGKSTTGRCLLRLIEPTSGKIHYRDTDLTVLDTGRLRPYRRYLQIVFQDPFSSLNPRLTVESMLSEILVFHKLAEVENVSKRIVELLEMVGLSSEHRHKYPHEFSGGQRQRIGIARALAVEPEFIVCDEPVSALDVSIQAQIINLLSDLQRQLSLSYLFIAHDLAVVRHISDRVAVMYLGKIVEIADTVQLYTNPLHPYTQILLSSVPSPDPDHRKTMIPLKGEIPSSFDPPSGCEFHTRCPFAKKECAETIPEFKNTGQDHWVSCHLVN
jgi:oligopeptide/dipeptide ABC transporter ATP-binding protein